MLSVTALFASVFTFFFIRLAFNVIKLRRANRVALGNGGFDDLESAIRAHGNFAEYVPLGLILLGLLEANEGNLGLVAVLGITLLIGRLFHFKGLETGDLKKRVHGMKLTFGTLATLAIVNIFYAIRSWVA